MKRRIDQLLVERGLAESRHKAQALLMGGRVRVNEILVDKPGHQVDVAASIRITEQLPFVSRGGLKLKGALDHFHINPEGRTCVDLGASTGGFTDCLLQHGAQTVHAFDVGKGQLDWKLRNDPRVIIRDDFNVRNITAADIPKDTSLVTADLSFISLTKILPPLKTALQVGSHAGSGGFRGFPVDLVLLVKPQFEVGKGQVGKGGVVRDPEKRLGALESVRQFALNCGFEVAGCLTSPIAGAKGNEEFLLYLRLFPDLSSLA
jgi:23S rRNA (cytidine1920-2'-O)/16S rRNA (cytidine1409-2'-O)-methyltransferase